MSPAHTSKAQNFTQYYFAMHVNSLIPPAFTLPKVFGYFCWAALMSCSNLFHIFKPIPKVFGLSSVFLSMEQSWLYWWHCPASSSIMIQTPLLLVADAACYC